MKSVDKIKEKISLMIQNNGSDSSVITYIFSNIRITLEKKNEKYKYPFLSMYCNWYQHHELDKSDIGYEIIQKIGNVFFDDIVSTANGKEPDYDTFIKHASNSIGLSNLKSDLLKFFKNHDIDPIIFSEKNWPQLEVHILNDLTERPIILPDLQSLSKKQVKAKNIVKTLQSRSMQIYGDRWELFMPKSILIDTKDGAFCWVLNLNSSISIAGPMIKS